MRDVIVIGCGGGGPVVAKELAARGLDVLVLESGPRFVDSEKEFVPTDFTAIDRFYPGFAESRTRAFRFQVSGVGGTTLHYYGNSPRAMPQVFRGSGADPTRFDVAHAFPFSYEELLPYYEWVEQTLPVQTAPMDTKARVFLDGARASGLAVQTSKDIGDAWTFRPQENAILQPSGNAGRLTSLRHSGSNPLAYPEAGGCTFCGYCQVGCSEPFGAPRNLKAKRSTDNSYVPMALTADRWTGGRAVDLRSDCVVREILWDRRGLVRGRAVGVRWRERDTQLLHTEEAHVIVLAGGALESPRLWLNSRLPNPNDWVGRGYTDHYVDLVLGIVPYDANLSKGPSSNARADLPGFGSMEVAGSTPGSIAALACQSDAGFRDDSGAGPTQLSGIGRLVGNDLRAMLADVNHTFGIAILTDDPVERANRVRTSLLFRDEDGPIPRVEVPRRSQAARKKRDVLVSKALEIMLAAGANNVARADASAITIHPMSSLRMGESALDSVLDASGEARFVERLFVADNSALANSLGGPNPTLTTQAVATRTAERIFSKYFAGDPWVERGDGFVSSVDERVTQAVIDAGL